MIDTIIYEQPLNETIRLCLRLEHLFTQFHNEAQKESSASTHLAMLSLLRILAVIDRPDLKSKITQALSQQKAALLPLTHVEQVDQTQLVVFLKQLDEKLEAFHSHHKKIGEQLRNNTFISQLYGQQNHPAGLCAFSSPAYSLWKRKPSAERTHDLNTWFEEFTLLETAVILILKLTRDSTPPKIIQIQEIGRAHV